MAKVVVKQYNDDGSKQVLFSGSYRDMVEHIAKDYSKFVQPKAQEITLKAWWKARVRYIGTDSTYIRFTPNFGFSLPWFGGRIRYAKHHGVQYVKWSNGRWRVARQLLGKSTVKGESYAPIR